ncbi:alpha-L-fucosidase [Lentilactobacillus kisonensis]|uniref:alpha-L-fucosidase n=1 Tax=Lentilactobacillus kisonensis TaxID=481722 RepID=UPI000AD7F1B5|nr:alpha-L-fucosidase [Lentilactobacillus kisonensis]
MTRLENFTHDRFGLFMHFGAYSVASEPDGGEWVRSTKQLTIEDYQPYVDQFNPVDFEPLEIAKKKPRKLDLNTR